MSTSCRPTRSAPAPRFAATLRRARDEDAAHGLSRRAKEVSAILKRRCLIAAQPQPGFMDEGRGLKCLSGDFVRHSPGRQTAKLFIDERQEFLGGFRIALFQPTQNLRDSRHGLRMRRKRRKSESRCGFEWSAVVRSWR